MYLCEVRQGRWRVSVDGEWGNECGRLQKVGDGAVQVNGRIGGWLHQQKTSQVKARLKSRRENQILFGILEKYN